MMPREQKLLEYLTNHNWDELAYREFRIAARIGKWAVHPPPNNFVLFHNGGNPGKYGTGHSYCMTSASIEERKAVLMLRTTRCWRIRWEN